MKDTRYFGDKNVARTEKAILEAVGRAADAWQKLFTKIHADHPDISETWNYYNDGKSWLCKVTRKSKTVFWASVFKGSFKVVFYFPLRLKDDLLKSDLSEERKMEIQNHKPIGKLMGVRIAFGPQRGIPDAMKLIELKKRLK